MISSSTWLWDPWCVQCTRHVRIRNVPGFFPLGILKGTSNVHIPNCNHDFFSPSKHNSPFLYTSIIGGIALPLITETRNNGLFFNFYFFRASFPTSTSSPILGNSYPILFLLLTYAVLSLLYYLKIFLPDLLTLPSSLFSLLTLLVEITTRMMKICHWLPITPEWSSFCLLRLKRVWSDSCAPSPIYFVISDDTMPFNALMMLNFLVFSK